MGAFVLTVKKAGQGVLYVDIPAVVMKEMNLKPFMAARMRPEKGEIVISGFEKTVKIKIDLSKKDIDMLKIIMQEEGYASLDETASNALHWFFEKGKTQTHIVYIYPEGYLKSRCILIDDFEKTKAVSIKKLFGTAKSKKSAQQIKDELRAGWQSKRKL